jgi:hypothetical protein
MKCLGGKLGGEVVSEYDTEADARVAIQDIYYGEPKADRCVDMLEDGTRVWVIGAGDYYLYVD